MATGTATPTVCVPAPLPHQIEILLDDSRFKLAVCGRRFGKTATGLLAALRGHGPTPGHFKGAIDGGRIWWVSPSYPTLKSSNIWDDLKRATQACWQNKHGSKSEVDKEIKLPGGGSITVRSADNPDSLRGPGLDGLILDEAAFTSVKAWTTLRPALTDRQGWCMFITTPNGRNWIYDRFEMAQNGREGWKAWQKPSSCNPVLAPSELEEAKIELGSREYAQEHDAQFIHVKGALFPAEYFGSHLWASRWPDSFQVSAIAVDPSMGATEQSDYSAIVFVGVADGLLWVACDIERRPPLQIVQDTIAMYATYQPQLVGVEAIAFQGVLAPIFDLICQRDGLPPLPLHMINSHKGQGKMRIKRLDPHLERKKIRVKRDASGELLYEQLMMFPLKEYHDDGPDALEMAIRLLNHRLSGA